MANIIITALVGLVCTIVTSTITFFHTRKKYNTEVESIQIKNLKNSIDLYKEVTGETITTLNNRINKLQKENDELKAQVAHLQSQMVHMLDAICYDTTCKIRKANFPIATATDNSK